MLSIIEFELTEDGPYGNVGGSPWTDVNTFMANGPLTAIEIRAGGAIDGLRARYSTVQYCNLFFCYLLGYCNQILKISSI